MSQHIGIAYMTCIVIFLLVRFEMCFYFFVRTHRQSNSNELATLFGIDTFGGFSNGFVCIFHAFRIKNGKLKIENYYAAYYAVNFQFSTLHFQLTKFMNHQPRTKFRFKPGSLRRHDIASISNIHQLFH